MVMNSLVSNSISKPWCILRFLINLFLTFLSKVSPKYFKNNLFLKTTKIKNLRWQLRSQELVADWIKALRMGTMAKHLWFLALADHWPMQHECNATFTESISGYDIQMVRHIERWRVPGQVWVGQGGGHGSLRAPCKNKHDPLVGIVAVFGHRAFFDVWN